MGEEEKKKVPGLEETGTTLQYVPDVWDKVLGETVTYLMTSDNPEKRPYINKEFMDKQGHWDYCDNYFRFHKEMRDSVLHMTMDGLADQIGVSKGHVAKMESGKASIPLTLSLLFWDLVEVRLKNNGKEWKSIGLQFVDMFVPVSYKKRRAWKPDRTFKFMHAGKVHRDTEFATFTPPQVNSITDDEFFEIAKSNIKGISESAKDVYRGDFSTDEQISKDTEKAVFSWLLDFGSKVKKDRESTSQGLLSSPKIGKDEAEKIYFRERAAELEAWVLSLNESFESHQEAWKENEKVTNKFMEEFKKIDEELKEKRLKLYSLQERFEFQQKELAMKDDAIAMKNDAISRQDILIAELRERIQELKIHVQHDALISSTVGVPLHTVKDEPVVGIQGSTTMKYSEKKFGTNVKIAQPGESPVPKAKEKTEEENDG